MNVVRLLIGSLLVSSCMLAVAADFEVISSRSSYSLIATGEIAAGDSDMLREIIRGKGGLPQATRIETASGDLAEAMKLGRLYRRASLSTMAGEGCDDACFLWLLGGVSRSLTGDLILSGKVSAPGAVMDYLMEMEVPDQVVVELTVKRAREPTTLTPEEFDHLVGERPASIVEAMLLRCGDLTEREQQDLWRFQASGFLDVLMRMRAANPQRRDLDSIIEKYQGLAAEAGTLTDVYLQSLADKWTEIRECRAEAFEAGQLEFEAALAVDEVKPDKR